ncbi:MAG: DUF2173 family protein [candidate division Zixibacteria bacterium]|nr:DUF2173 family protein [candidate division Zixibacteria bacterium]
MIGLDRLMKQKGVIAVGQFSEDGKIIRKAGDISENIMEQIAKKCAYHNQKAEELTKYFSANSEMDWTPLVGWAVLGGNYAIFIMDNTGIIVDSRKADLNQLVIDLRESGPTGPRPRNY